MNGKLKPNIDLFTTSDLALAAVVALYYSIESIDKSNPKKVLFIFKKDKNFHLCIEKYWNGELKVEPLKFYQCLKMLKNRIYND